MQPEYFHRRYSKLFWRMLGPNANLYRWFVTARRFLVDATQNSNRNNWQWPGFYMTRAEVEHAAFEATSQFAIQTNRRDEL